MFVDSVDVKIDYSIFQTIYKVAFYMGITPSKIRNLSDPISYPRKAYIIFLNIIFILGNYLKFSIRIVDPVISRPAVAFLDVNEIIFSAFNINLLISLSTFSHVKIWQQFINTFEETEGYFKDKIKLNFNIKWTHVRIIFIYISLFIIFCNDMTTMLTAYEALCYTTFYLIIIYQLWAQILIITMLRILNRRYGFFLLEITKCIHEKGANENTKIGKIKQMVKAYRKLGDTIKLFNRIFGPFLCSYFCYFVLMSVYWICTLIYIHKVKTFIFFIILPLYLIHTVLKRKSMNTHYPAYLISTFLSSW